MKPRLRRKHWIAIVPVGIGAGVILAVLALRNPQPPLNRLEHAESAMEQASVAGASTYAAEAYRLAEQTFQDGWLEMARQRGRLRPIRDYDLADSLLSLAIARAETAAAAATDSTRRVEVKANGEFALLQDHLRAQRDAIDSLLRNNQAERHWSLAHASLLVTEALLREGAYEDALESLAQGRASLDRLDAILAEYSSDEQARLLLWRRWVDETLSESRRGGGYAVIVDKSAHRLYLARAGKMVAAYICELGHNPAYQKRYAGDGATPEGKYRVTVAKPRGSKYYKALLLDYPNKQDRETFRDNKAKGIIHTDARPGGYIEIHGEGGKGTDWTDGCVALRNKDMDALMKHVGVGTAVTIVRKSDLWP